MKLERKNLKAAASALKGIERKGTKLEKQYQKELNRFTKKENVLPGCLSTAEEKVDMAREFGIDYSAEQAIQDLANSLVTNIERGFTI